MAVGTDAMVVVVVVVVVVFLSVWRLLVRAGDHLVRVECRIEKILANTKKAFHKQRPRATAATGFPQTSGYRLISNCCCKRSNRQFIHVPVSIPEPY